MRKESARKDDVITGWKLESLSYLPVVLIFA